ncbi:MAG: anaerobic ribonucleoside-triphosphate reductase activating protein [Clostridia bacterium]|nr:anaerobic ribonucleoside-triphosphate reductase activating protein [Clostridia bacterium]
MIIKGLQKLTLLDYPGHLACTVFTGGCNFRCPFCHNASLVTGKNEEDYTEDEIFEFLGKRQGTLEGVAITGGEPLLQSDIVEFIKRVKNMGFKVKLDTNGSFPEKLKEIVSAGLVDYVAVDIKNSLNKYSETVGRLGYDTERVCESIEFLMNSDVDYEFRTTVVSELHTAEDIEKIGKQIAGAKRWYLQNFVDSGDLICAEMHGISKDLMKQYIEIAKKYVPTAELRGV